MSIADIKKQVQNRDLDEQQKKLAELNENMDYLEEYLSKHFKIQYNGILNYFNSDDFDKQLEDYIHNMAIEKQQEEFKLTLGTYSKLDDGLEISFRIYEFLYQVEIMNHSQFNKQIENYARMSEDNQNAVDRVLQTYTYIIILNKYIANFIGDVNDALVEKIKDTRDIKIKRLPEIEEIDYIDRVLGEIGDEREIHSKIYFTFD